MNQPRTNGGLIYDVALGQQDSETKGIVHSVRKLPRTCGTSKSFDQKKLPLVTAVMVTGKWSERIPMARIAAKCFLAQTYAQKELLILNDSNEAIGMEAPCIREIMVQRQDHLTLGDLRNLAFAEARGSWLIQWDDDDWHAPERICLQMKKRRENAAVLLKSQIRSNLLTGSACQFSVPRGIHGTILHSRSTHFRYPSIRRKEDTYFLEQFSARVIVDNDPITYVRLFHGYNTWDEKHIMGDLAGTNRVIRLSPSQTEFVKSTVLPCYMQLTT